MSVEAVRQRYEGQLMRLPNVSGVGIGQRAGKEVLKVFVTHKVPESALRPEEVIPRHLEECEVDVEEIGHLTTQV